MKQDKKDECFNIITEIDNINILIPQTHDRSEKTKLSGRKGKLLENLASIILNVRNTHKVRERVTCRSNEIDLLMSAATNAGLFEKILPEPMKGDYVVECKNHNKTIDVTLVGKFYSVMRYKKSKFGVMVSYLSLTRGTTEWDQAVGLTKKLHLLDGSIIINFTMEEIKDILENKSGNFLAAMKRKIDDIVYHSRLVTEQIIEHEAETIEWEYIE